MDGEDFEDLLTGSLSASARWQPSTPCPCTQPRGGADPACLVCHGIGTSYGPFSDPFRCGLTGMSSRNRAAMAQMMGPGAIGDSVLILPHSAPPYKEIREGDRIWDQRVEDRYRLVLQPGTKLGLPYGYRHLGTYVKSADGRSLILGPTPVPDEFRVVSVAQTSTLFFFAPRCYEVLKELSHVRSFGDGLPRRISLVQLDASMRSPRAAQTIER